MSRTVKKRLIATFSAITLCVCAVTIGLQALEVYGSALLSSYSMRQRKAAHYARIASHVEAHSTVFYGDSLTEMYDLTYWYPGKHYVNRGISGDTTDHMIERINTNLIDLQPDTVVLLAGANDFRAGQSVDTVVQNLRTIIETVQRELPNTRILVQSLYPVHPSEEILMSQKLLRQLDNSKILAANRELQLVCAELAVSYVDVHARLTDSQGNLRREFTIDGLHLNTAGYRVVTDTLDQWL